MSSVVDLYENEDVLSQGDTSDLEAFSRRLKVRGRIAAVSIACLALSIVLIAIPGVHGALKIAVAVASWVFYLVATQRLRKAAHSVLGTARERLASIISYHEEQKRQARGNVSLFEDWEVRSLWKAWNDELEERAQQRLEGSEEQPLQNIILDAKQSALEELVQLAQEDPDVTLQGWHEHMEAYLTDLQAQIADVRQQVPDDEESLDGLECEVIATRKIVDHIKQSYAL